MRAFKSDDHVIFHIFLSLFLDVFVESWLEEARVTNAIIVLACHALISCLLQLRINTATSSLLHSRPKSLLYIRCRYGLVPLLQTIFHHDVLELRFHRFDIVLVFVVARAQVGLVVFDDINITILSILPGHNLDLLLSLESLTSTVERY